MILDDNSDSRMIHHTHVVVVVDKYIYFYSYQGRISELRDKSSCPPILMPKSIYVFSHVCICYTPFVIKQNISSYCVYLVTGNIEGCYIGTLYIFLEFLPMLRYSSCFIITDKAFIRKIISRITWGDTLCM